MMRNFNYGYIEEAPAPEDYTFGALGTAILKPDANWTNVLPVFEHQRKGTETQACVSFGTNSALEMIHKLKYRTEPNWSDRFLAKLSETGKSGNTPKQVVHTARHSGAVNEAKWPFNANFSWNEYYAEIPQNIVSEGLQWLEGYSVGYEWVGTSHVELKEALKRSPVGVSVYAWAKNDKGEYYVPQGARANHWVILVAFDGDNPVIFDSYEEELKTLSKDFPFSFAMGYSLDKKEAGDKVEKWWSFLKEIVYFIRDLFRI